MKKFLQRLFRLVVMTLVFTGTLFLAFRQGVQHGITLARPLRMPTVLEIQHVLKTMGEPRYDPGKVDDDPGPSFRVAYNAYRFDLYAQVYFPKEGDR